MKFDCKFLPCNVIVSTSIWGNKIHIFCCLACAHEQSAECSGASESKLCSNGSDDDNNCTGRRENITFVCLSVRVPLQIPLLFWNSISIRQSEHKLCVLSTKQPRRRGRLEDYEDHDDDDEKSKQAEKDETKKYQNSVCPYWFDVDRLIDDHDQTAAKLLERRRLWWNGNQFLSSSPVFAQVRCTQIIERVLPVRLVSLILVLMWAQKPRQSLYFPSFVGAAASFSLRTLPCLT